MQYNLKVDKQKLFPFKKFQIKNLVKMKIMKSKKKNYNDRKNKKKN